MSLLGPIVLRARGLAHERSRATRNRLWELDFCIDSTYDGAGPVFGFETLFSSEFGLALVLVQILS